MMRDFWSGRTVLVTGHTGFTGAWMARWLQLHGANVHGIALEPVGTPNLYASASIASGLTSRYIDIRDDTLLCAEIVRINPSIIIHLAAQALVLPSYRAPKATWDTNLVGTINLLEAARQVSAIEIVLVVTSDKVYRNDNKRQVFVETDPLGGDDPYSSSKAAAEIAVASWRTSFPRAHTKIMTARAGNIIGGGDWAEYRLVPDIVRAIMSGEALVLRNPKATRPWQHVLDAISGYLMYIEFAAKEDAPFELNFGPSAKNAVNVEQLAHQIRDALGIQLQIRCEQSSDNLEKDFLSLNASLAHKSIQWTPKLNMEQTTEWTAHWYARWLKGEAASDIVDQQLHDYWSL
jgi:CDP-glucose 4,6-dehydratase